VGPVSFLLDAGAAGMAAARGARLRVRASVCLNEAMIWFGEKTKK
jgi:hypothetical protein